jgi:hypothetical protein
MESSSEQVPGITATTGADITGVAGTGTADIPDMAIAPVMAGTMAAIATVIQTGATEVDTVGTMATGAGGMIVDTAEAT